MEVLEERNGADSELLIFTMTLINKVKVNVINCRKKKHILNSNFSFPLCQTLAALPDQDSFYDVTDSLEQLGMEAVIHKHLNNKATEPDIRAQFTTYEVQSHCCPLTSITLKNHVWNSFIKMNS